MHTEGALFPHFSGHNFTSCPEQFLNETCNGTFRANREDINFFVLRWSAKSKCHEIWHYLARQIITNNDSIGDTAQKLKLHSHTTLIVLLLMISIATCLGWSEFHLLTHFWWWMMAWAADAGGTRVVDSVASCFISSVDTLFSWHWYTYNHKHDVVLQMRVFPSSSWKLGEKMEIYILHWECTHLFAAYVCINLYMHVWC